MISSLVELPNASQPSVTLQLGEQSFESANELKKFVHAIIKTYPPGTAVTDQKIERMLLELFNFHPKGAEKLLNFHQIVVDVHSASGKATKCLFIEKLNGERNEISFIKSVNAMTRSEFVTKGYMTQVEESSDAIIDSLAAFLRCTPAMSYRVKDLVSDLFPHKTADIDTQKYAIRNLLLLAQYCPNVTEHIVRVVIEKIAVLDQDQLALKDIDSLLAVLLSWVDKEYTEDLSQMFLNVFNEIILPTQNPQYLQTIILIFCEKGGSEFVERLLSMLLNKIKLRQ